MRKISNSEVTAWLTCRRMYLYAFFRNLAPKVTPMALARGTLGHLAFERYCQARIEGLSHEAAMEAAMSAFKEAMSNMDVGTVMQTQYIFTRYMNHHKGWPEWEILAVEEQIDLKITDDITIPIRYDIKVREIATNKILIGDWKFTYDFWSDDDHALNGQMPKYILIMNMNGINVQGGFIEEIRTRDLGAAKQADTRNLWRRTYYYPSMKKMRSVLKQHVGASLEISKFRDLDDNGREDAAIPVLNKHGACKYCNFKALCRAQLDGGEIELLSDMEFTQNTYGYNDQKAIEELL